MSSLLQSLPGIEMPISEINRQLHLMWESPDRSQNQAPSQFRASQMNLILHFGFETTPAEARQRFEEVISFSQRHPSRVVVLCPREEQVDSPVMQGKLFAQCYIGRNHRAMCYCEALMLGYAPDDKGYLENQVSTWLENDLPIYHWLHRVPLERVRSQYRDFLGQMKRVLFDTSVEGIEYDEIWRVPGLSRRTYDLAYARLLPIRQPVGQFLGGIAPRFLGEGLREIQIRYGGERPGEALNLKKWMLCSLYSCMERDRYQALKVVLKEDGRFGGDDIDCLWKYENKEKGFHLRIEGKRKLLGIAFSSGKGRQERNIYFEPLKAPQMLGEAVFF